MYKRQGDSGTGSGCSGNEVLKPLPLVTRIIGKRGKRKDIMKPEEKYTVGINNDIIQSQSKA